VLEAFCETEIPMPRSGKWANAGMVRGRSVDLAWIVKDSAQHFRVPQRRKRLFLVADFTGRRAGEILFISQSLSGYFAAREREGKGIAAYAESRAGGAGQYGRGVGFDGYNCALTGAVTSTLGVNCGVSTGRNGVLQQENRADGNEERRVSVFMAGQAKNARSIAYSETVSPTLKGSPSGLNQMPCICEPQLARTLTARADSSPCVDRGQNIVTIPQPDAISFSQNQRCEVRDLHDLAACLAANPGMKQQTYVAQCAEPSSVHPEVTGTLCGSGAGLSRPAGMASETDLCVVIPAAEPIPIHDKATRCKGGGPTRNNDGAGNGLGIGKSGDPVPTMTANDRHIIAAVDCRNLNEGEVSGTLQSKSTGGYSLNYQNPIRSGYIIRRLTPTEAERLMSLPDGWTALGYDGKIMSDSARYSMCGNSIVVNCLAYIMQNISDALSRTVPVKHEEMEGGV
jgi:DNA (cytosine-5)-methyltransferase 1